MRIKNSPVLVETFVNDTELLGVQSVACGHNHTVASTLSGHIYSWGANENGVLGTGTTNNQYKP